MPTYKCPQCKQVGEIGISRKYEPNMTFTARGQVAGKLVIKCLECGAGFLKRGIFSKKLTIIPPHEWALMQSEWNENFPDNSD